MPLMPTKLSSRRRWMRSSSFFRSCAGNLIHLRRKVELAKNSWDIVRQAGVQAAGAGGRRQEQTAGESLSIIICHWQIHLEVQQRALDFGPLGRNGYGPEC